MGVPAKPRGQSYAIRRVHPCATPGCDRQTSATRCKRCVRVQRPNKGEDRPMTQHMEIVFTTRKGEKILYSYVAGEQLVIMTTQRVAVVAVGRLGLGAAA